MEGLLAGKRERYQKSKEGFILYLGILGVVLLCCFIVLFDGGPLRPPVLEKGVMLGVVS